MPPIKWPEVSTMFWMPFSVVVLCQIMNPFVEIAKVTKNPVRKTKLQKWAFLRLRILTSNLEFICCYFVVIASLSQLKTNWKNEFIMTQMTRLQSCESLVLEFIWTLTSFKQVRAILKHCFIWECMILLKTRYWHSLFLKVVNLKSCTTVQL